MRCFEFVLRFFVVVFFEFFYEFFKNIDIVGPGGQKYVILGPRGALGAWISEF